MYVQYYIVPFWLYRQVHIAMNIFHLHAFPALSYFYLVVPGTNKKPAEAGFIIIVFAVKSLTTAL